jgi:hypothetical protein
MPYHVVTSAVGQPAHTGIGTAVIKQRLTLLMAVGLAAVGIAAGAVALAWPSSTTAAAGTLKPVSDVDASIRACLLEAPAGSPAARPARQGLARAAQARKHMLVQQFTVPANVSPASMLAELTALHCTTVVTVGSQAEAQVRARASKGTRYLVIGTPMPKHPNITVIPPASASSTSVESAVLNLVVP